MGGRLVNINIDNTGVGIVRVTATNDGDDEQRCYVRVCALEQIGALEVSELGKAMELDCKTPIARIRRRYGIKYLCCKRRAGKKKK